ncbi:MAG: ATP-dependent helicase [Candidatus Omnitrophota bacterium]
MSPSIEYKTALNKQQQEAVLSTEGPHLVIAGAGSGKTRVLIFRTAYLVEKGIDPENILLLTFTRRAANEMLNRACAILDDRCRNVSGGTFHSFANSILREYAERIDLPRNFTILDQADSEALISRIRKEKKLTQIDKRFPRKSALMDVISKTVNKDSDTQTVLAEEYPHFCQWSDVIEDVRLQYRKMKAAMAALDFDDLLVRLENLLTTKSDIRETLSRQYRYIMVDEYQDTNSLQARIIRLLCSAHNNIMAVGDDSQSIYSFRGAQFKNIIDFPKTFTGAKVITLEENYRSSQPILDLTNEVILSAREGFNKELFTRQTGEVRPLYRDTYNENAQSYFILRKITALQKEGVDPSQIAVLFRSGWHSNDLEVTLASHRVPFIKYGGQRFVEAAHIKDVICFLRLLDNIREEVSWSRVLLLMPGIGPQTAARIMTEIKTRSRATLDGLSYYAKNEHVRRLCDYLMRADMDVLTPSALLETALEWYHPYLIETYDDYDKRINDLESLQNITERYQDLPNLLADLALDPPESSLVNARRARQDHDALTLSTIHSAKGLEWHTVFMIHVSEGFLPSYRSLNNPDAIEEERRLFYVAATRAKKNLFILRPLMNSSVRAHQTGADSRYTRASRFLGEGRVLDLVDIESDQRGGYSSRPQQQNAYEEYVDQLPDDDPFLLDTW